MSLGQRQRFYFVKIPESFLDNHRIRLLRHRDYPVGIIASDMYILLLAESASHNGRLRCDDRTPYTPEDIAILLGLPKDDGVKAFGLLSKYNLVSVEKDGTIVLPDFDEYVGSETMDAQRKRAERGVLEDVPAMSKGRKEDGERTSGGQREDRKRTKRGQAEDKERKTSSRVLEIKSTRDLDNNTDTNPPSPPLGGASLGGGENDRPSGRVEFAEDAAANSTAPLHTVVKMSPEQIEAALKPLPAPFPVETVVRKIVSNNATVGRCDGKPITEAEVRSWYAYQESEGGWRYQDNIGTPITPAHFLGSLRAHVRRARKEESDRRKAAEAKRMTREELAAVVERLNANRTSPITPVQADAFWNWLVGTDFRNRKGEIVTAENAAPTLTTFVEIHSGEEGGGQQDPHRMFDENGDSYAEIQRIERERLAPIRAIRQYWKAIGTRPACTQEWFDNLVCVKEWRKTHKPDDRPWEKLCD